MVRTQFTCGDHIKHSSFCSPINCTYKKKLKTEHLIFSCWPKDCLANCVNSRREIFPKSCWLIAFANQPKKKRKFFTDGVLKGVKRKLFFTDRILKVLKRKLFTERILKGVKSNHVNSVYPCTVSLLIELCRSQCV